MESTLKQLATVSFYNKFVKPGVDTFSNVELFGETIPGPLHEIVSCIEPLRTINVRLGVLQVRGSETTELGLEGLIIVVVAAAVQLPNAPTTV